MGKGAYPALIHCFTASAGFARAMLDLGLYISVAGIVTFKNARDLQETVATLPGDRMLIETDAPFLAPVPHRGKPGEPAFVADTAAFIANLRGEDTQELMDRTSRNFFRLFAKAKP
jgi:TatD DNase family protein